MNKDQEDMWNRLKEQAPITTEFGTKLWYNKSGELHRENDMPAVISSTGDKHWWKNGKRHRDNDLPAVIYLDGYNEWYKNGKVHRDNDMPAIIGKYAFKAWYKNGNKLTGFALLKLKLRNWRKHK